jgi:hypothetical protein
VFAGDFCTKGCRTDAECSGGETCCGNDLCQGTDAGNNCEFTKGTFKTQVGSTTQFQLSGVACGIGTYMCSKNGKPCPTMTECSTTDGTCTNKGVLLTDPAHTDPTSPLQSFITKYCASSGAPCNADNQCADIGGAPIPGDCQATKRTLLCSEETILSTIMDQERADDGTLTPKSCIQTVNVAGKSNYVISSIGFLSCKSGTCKAVLANNISGGGDPCPDVDKVSEVRRMTVMDSYHVGEANVLGNTLRACCEPGAAAVGGAPIACGNTNQDVLAEMGNVVQGVAP